MLDRDLQLQTTDHWFLKLFHYSFHDFYFCRNTVESVNSTWIYVQDIIWHLFAQLWNRRCFTAFLASRNKGLAGIVLSWRHVIENHHWERQDQTELWRHHFPVTELRLRERGEGDIWLSADGAMTIQQHNNNHHIVIIQLLLTYSSVFHLKAQRLMWGCLHDVWKKDAYCQIPLCRCKLNC